MRPCRDGPLPLRRGADTDTDQRRPVGPIALATSRGSVLGAGNAGPSTFAQASSAWASRWRERRHEHGRGLAQPGPALTQATIALQFLVDMVEAPGQWDAGPRQRQVVLGALEECERCVCPTGRLRERFVEDRLRQVRRQRLSCAGELVKEPFQYLQMRVIGTYTPSGLRVLRLAGRGLPLGVRGTPLLDPRLAVNVGQQQPAGTVIQRRDQIGPEGVARQLALDSAALVVAP